MKTIKVKRPIKFYLDESVNNIKKDRIIKFLKECQEVENKLLIYYWENDNFKIITQSEAQIDFNYNNKTNYKDIEPRLKSHHFQQCLQQVFKELKSIQSNIIKRIHFNLNNKIEQKIYNYCKGFCFRWDDLKKYNEKQLKKYKKDKSYYEFLLEVNKYLIDEELFHELKKCVEGKFYEIKAIYKLPTKKEYQIWCNKAHTVDIELKEFQWIFKIDNNDVIGGTEKKAVYGSMLIPVKFSKYHKKVLKGKTLANSFCLRLNKYDRIEIIGIYEDDIAYNKNEIKDVVGVDIGLKKLIMCSDGEIVEQNKLILYKLNKVVKKQANRQTLEKHLQKKLNDEDIRLGDKCYLRMQRKLSTFVKTDNRYRVKQFLKGREYDHIIIEDLDLGYSKTKSKQVNYLLKRLGIQNIKNDLLKYCKEMGINISMINPAFTSQQCPVCGYVSRDNRKTQEMFSCVKCGHTDNADRNASINIRDRIKDKRINLSTPYWKVKEILQIT